MLSNVAFQPWLKNDEQIENYYDKVRLVWTHLLSLILTTLLNLHSQMGDVIPGHFLETI